MRSWKFWLGVAVSALFVYWTATGLEWHAFWGALGQAQYAWLVPAVMVYFGAVWARTWRWHYMLRHMNAIPLRRLFPVVVIGYMGNNVYPARAGEVIRSYVLKRNEGVSISASLATVALERLFDGLVICTFIFATLPFVPLPSVYRRLVAGFSTLFFLALILFLVLAAEPERTDKLAARIIARLVPERLRPKVGDLAAKFLHGLGSLRSPREVLMIFLTSIAIWITEAATYWVVMRAFPFSVSFPALMLMMAVVNLFTMIPSAPGYVGTFDKPGIEVLKSFGVAQATAAAYTIVLHVALWLPITLLGLFYMSHASLKWREIDEAVGESRSGSPVERPVPDPSSLGMLLALVGAAALLQRYL
ncbi:MAG: flippase-like domain-containing protein [Chloroflexota bacterium]|nr:flippase-like domain-containing protein [Chloroflexota bacterium]